MSLIDLAVRGAVQVISQYADTISENRDKRVRPAFAGGIYYSPPNDSVQEHLQRYFDNQAWDTIRKAPAYQYEDTCYKWFRKYTQPASWQNSVQFSGSESLPDSCRNEDYEKAVGFLKLQDECFLLGRDLRQIARQCSRDNDDLNPMMKRICISIGDKLLEKQLPVEDGAIETYLSELENDTFRFKVALLASSILYYATGAFLFV